MENKFGVHQSGMPDANYLRMVARAEFAWNHRMEPDPLEGFEKPSSLQIPETGEVMPATGSINFGEEPKHSTDIEEAILKEFQRDRGFGTPETRMEAARIRIMERIKAVPEIGA